MSERVPDGWMLKIVRDTSKLSAGGTPSTQVTEYWENGTIPWMSSGEVHKKRVHSVDNCITTLGLENSSAKMFPSKSILVALAGQGKTRGTVAISEIELTTNQSIAAIIVKDKSVYPDFLYHNLDSRYEELRGVSGGSGRAGLNLAILGDLDVLLPPLPEQQKIAKILTSVDQVIEKTQAQIDKLKDLKTGMMQELLTQGVGVDGKPHTEFKDSPVGWIPKTWDLEPLANFTTFISYGFTNPMPEAEVGPYMITAKDVNDLKVQYSTSRKTTQEAFDNLLTRKSRPQVNDILLTKDGTLGRVALVTDSNCCINQSVAVLTPNERVIPKFLLYLLASPRYQQEMLENAGGSTIKHIYITVVDKMLVGVPSVTEQQKLVDIFDSVFRKLELTENKLSKLNDTKKALMQDLLTGKVRVNID
ncbi:restriction endonuclease subunit S [Shewanella sp. W3-18-1]|uniref:restriction endonuclease subunit S n=1 Tax=Shewanella sp. (strain W3-18-1) TaxID=351745 RepID=UPI00005FDE7F|nr:restriction endonuclease subunit S [Shewanella sp. W3-18-1]ABM23169.1 restriction modification system DNA specificity domain [Shewanella sp. W3-18-1]